MDRSINLAIVGCGWAGLRHARGCKTQGVLVSWAVDLDQQRASAVCDALGFDGNHTKISCDIADVLEDPKVDGVILCLPHHLHAPMALRAAGAGKHILVEKPLAANLKEADAMIAAARQAGVVLMVAENVRFDPIVRKIVDYLSTGLVGQPAMLQVTRQAYLRKSFIRDRSWFLDTREAAGGIMMSGGIHDFEMMHMLIGEIESVYSLKAPQRFMEMEGDDTSAALVKFRNGVVGVLVESFITKRLTTAAGPEVHTLRIDGAAGSIAWEGGHIIRIFTERDEGRIGDNLMAHDVFVPEQDTFASIDAHFSACIKTGQEPITSGRSQRHALAAVMAAYDSMQAGVPVVLDEMDVLHREVHA